MGVTGVKKRWRTRWGRSGTFRCLLWSFRVFCFQKTSKHRLGGIVDCYALLAASSTVQAPQICFKRRRTNRELCSLALASWMEMKRIDCLERLVVCRIGSKGLQVTQIVLLYRWHGVHANKPGHAHFQGRVRKPANAFALQRRQVSHGKAATGHQRRAHPYWRPVSIGIHIETAALVDFVLAITGYVTPSPTLKISTKKMRQ